MPICTSRRICSRWTRSTPSKTARRLQEILGQGYHVVVGNPPYITVKDKAQNEAYRDCTDLPSEILARRAVHSAILGTGDPGQGCGTSEIRNSFMKRELARTDRGLLTIYNDLNETNVNCMKPANVRHIRQLSRVHLRLHDHGQLVHEAGVRQEADRGVLPQDRPHPCHRHVRGVHPRPRHADCHPVRTQSQAGRRTVRAVLGIKGEPATPDDASQGLVWQSIVKQIDIADAQDEFTSTADVPRATFASHPWSIGGGGAAGLEGTD